MRAFLPQMVRGGKVLQLEAGQVIGNFNTLQMLRVRETATDFRKSVL